MAHCIVAVLVPDSEPDAQAAASTVLLAHPSSLLDGFYFVESREHVNMVFADGVLWARDKWEQQYEGGRPMTDEDEARLLATPGKVAVFANIHC